MHVDVPHILMVHVMLMNVHHRWSSCQHHLIIYHGDVLPVCWWTHLIIGSQAVGMADDLLVVLPQNQQETSHSPVPDLSLRPTQQYKQSAANGAVMEGVGYNEVRLRLRLLRDNPSCSTKKQGYTQNSTNTPIQSDVKNVFSYSQASQVSQSVGQSSSQSVSQSTDRSRKQAQLNTIMPGMYVTTYSTAVISV